MGWFDSPAPKPVEKPLLPPPFVPTFRRATVKSSQGGEWPVNEQYFATPETALEIMRRTGAMMLIEKPAGGSGGTFQVTFEDGKPAIELHVAFSGGLTINAGMLAGYYVRMPEDKFPGVADIFVHRMVATEHERLAQNG
jgi:hypothetical protein